MMDNKRHLNIKKNQAIFSVVASGVPWLSFYKGFRGFSSLYFLLLKMNSSAAKLLLLFLLFGLGVYMATSSTLLPHGDKKSSSSYIFDCKGVFRVITAREVGNFGCENLEAVEHKPVPSRSLRSLLIPPPSPIKNKAKTLDAPATPASPLVA